MATQKLRNISGKDRQIPTPDGQVLDAPANHQVEVDEALAKSLLQQSDNWERVTPPKQDKDGD